jgi:hypothetical protein
MKMVLSALALLLFASSSSVILVKPAAAAAPTEVVIDPRNAVRPSLLRKALAAWAAHPDSSRERLAVVDFTLPSHAPRLFVIDLRTGAVESFLTAHGRGSDPAHSGVANVFSNAEGSNASSLGAYLTLARYTGQHGLSLRLKGLEPSNSNAEVRAIVLHSAPYMDEQWRRTHGRPGRSFGCFTVETPHIEHVVSTLEGGVLLFAGR